MTTPDVPLRMEMTFELPGTPEQVWHAIATADGISAWFLPTDMDEREGGALTIHMGEASASHGRVIRWDPPHRLVYEEHDWADLAEHPDAPTTPLVSEFLVEATSGGTCVLRVVTSAFGTGADWEQEFFDDMEEGWRPSFDTLRLYLTHFPGQRATSLEVSVEVPGTVEDVWAGLRRELGTAEVGGAVEVRGHTGLLERVGATAGPRQLLVRLTTPVEGFLGFLAYVGPSGTVTAAVEGHLFSDDAAAYVDRERSAWRAWLERLAVTA